MPTTQTAAASTPTLAYALELALANELNLRDVYANLAARETETVIAEVWSAMAAAEAHHAELLGGIKQAIPARDLDSHIDFSLRPFDSFARQIDDFRERLNGGGLGRDDIFRYVLQLELGEQNGVLLELLTACPSSLATQLEHDVASPSDRHLQVLLNVIEHQSGDPDLRAQVRALRAEASL